MSIELASTFGGARLLAPHRLSDDVVISRAVQNVRRDLSRDPGPTNPASAFIARVHEKTRNLMTCTATIERLDQELASKGTEDNEMNHILHTVCLMTSGRCDLHCSHCYTDQATHQGTWNIYDAAIREAQTYGAKIVYIAGEGEPFLDEHIGSVIRLAADLGMEVLLFSNGLQFCHETTGYRRLRGRILGTRKETNAPDFAHWLSDMPVHLYLKMHSANRATQSRLCGLPKNGIDYTYETVMFENRSLDIPTPLLRLPDWGFPIERLGFDAMVIEKNADELRTLVGPWSQRAGLALYMEPLIPSGRVSLSNPEAQPDQLQALRDEGYLVRQDCTLNKIIGKIVVWGRGFVSPLLGFTWRDLQHRPSLVYRPEDGFIKQRDDHALFQQLRYQAGCPCAMGAERLRTLLDLHAPKQ